MLLGLGYGCRTRVCVRHRYGSIFVSFSIYLKDRSVIPMSGSERHTHVRHGYFRENEESEQHSMRTLFFLLFLFFIKEVVIIVLSKSGLWSPHIQYCEIHTECSFSFFPIPPISSQNSPMSNIYLIEIFFRYTNVSFECCCTKVSS